MNWWLHGWSVILIPKIDSRAERTVGNTCLEGIGWMPF
jgi:hypothetical protein